MWCREYAIVRPLNRAFAQHWASMTGWLKFLICSINYLKDLNFTRFVPPKWPCYWCSSKVNGNAIHHHIRLLQCDLRRIFHTLVSGIPWMHAYGNVWKFPDGSHAQKVIEWPMSQSLWKFPFGLKHCHQYYLSIISPTINKILYANMAIYPMLWRWISCWLETLID